MKNATELMKKLDILNKLNEELGIRRKYYLVLIPKYGRSLFYYKKQDLKYIKKLFIDEVADILLNNTLIREEDFYYKIDNCDEYSFRIGVL